LDEVSASNEASAHQEHITQEQAKSNAPNRAPIHDLSVPDVEDQTIVLIQINAYSHEEILRVGEKMDLQKVGWGMDWTDLAQDRERWRDLVNAIMNLQVPENAGNFSTS
jgi:hypothetical protein